MAELVSHGHCRPVADVHGALLDHEEPGRRGGPRIHIDPETHQRGGSLGIALASTEGPDLGAVFGGESYGRFTEGLEDLSDLRARRRARFGNQRGDNLIVHPLLPSAAVPRRCGSREWT